MIIHGKVALSTGAANRIGKATATEFIHNGAKVILADVQDDVGHAAAAGLCETPWPAATRQPEDDHGKPATSSRREEGNECGKICYRISVMLFEQATFRLHCPTGQLHGPLATHTRPAQYGHIIDLVATLLSRQRSALCHDLIRCDMSLRRSTPQDATDGNLASRTYQFSHVDEDYDKPTHFTRTCGVAALPFFTRRLYRIDSGSKFTVDRSSLAGNSENTGVVCRKGLELQNMEHRMNETP
jgi:hypothetical protein